MPRARLPPSPPGLCLWLAFPDADLWWLAPVGVALLARGDPDRRSPPRGFWLGLLAGLAFFVPVAVVVGRLRRGPAVVRPRHPPGALRRGHVGGRRVRRPAARRRRAHRRGLALVPLGWVVQEWARGATPYGGFPWARLAFSQADSPLAHVARLARRPGRDASPWRSSGTLPARRGHLRAVQRRVGPAAVAGRRRRRARRGRPAGRCRCRPTAGAVSVGFVQGNVPQAGPGVQRRAPGRARQPRPRHRGAGRPRARTTSASSCGRRTPPTSTRSATPTPRPRSTAPARPSACRCSSGPCSPSRPEPARTSRCSTCPGRASPQRYVKLHPVPFAEYIPNRAFFRTFSAEADLAGQLRRRLRGRRLPRRRRRAATTWPCRRSASRWPTTT